MTFGMGLRRGTPRLPEFFDSGPKGTWCLNGACPFYFRDSWHKLRFSGVTNPTLTISGYCQVTDGSTGVSIYKNGVFLANALGPFVAGVLGSVVAAVACIASDVLEIRAWGRWSIDNVSSSVPGLVFEPAPARPAKRYVLLGDSISQQFNASPANLCWANLFADSMAGTNWRITNFAYSGNLYNGYGNQATCDALMLRIRDRCDATVKNVVGVHLGVNDFNGGLTTATFAARVQTVLGTLRAALPGVGIVAFSPLITSNNDTQLNPAGASLPSFRAVIQAQAATMADTIYIDGLPVMTNADEVDGTHPNNAGMAKYEPAVRVPVFAQWGA